MLSSCRRDGTIFEAEVSLPMASIADRAAAERLMYERAYMEALAAMKQWLMPQLFDNGTEMVLRLRFSCLNIGPDPRHSEKRIAILQRPYATPALDQERIF